MASKEYMQDWRAKHKKEIQEYNKKWRTGNIVTVRAAQSAWRKNNPDKVKKQLAEKYKRNPERWARYQLKKIHGITLEQKEGLFESQGRKCAARGSTDCGSVTGSWALDHNHKTGFFRGVLCNSCNVALGLLKDSAERCQQLIAYLNFSPDYNFEVL